MWEVPNLCLIDARGDARDGYRGGFQPNALAGLGRPEVYVWEGQKVLLGEIF